MTGRHSRHFVIVAFVALWHAAMLFVCVPAADAAPTTAPATVPCCDARSHLPTPEDAPAPTNCVHCTNGVGQFVDAATPVPAATLHAFVERVTTVDLAAPSRPAVAMGDEWRQFRPPAPTLWGLRCALVR